MVKMGGRHHLDGDTLIEGPPSRETAGYDMRLSKLLYLADWGHDRQILVRVVLSGIICDHLR